MRALSPSKPSTATGSRGSGGEHESSVPCAEISASHSCCVNKGGRVYAAWGSRTLYAMACTTVKTNTWSVPGRRQAAASTVSGVCGGGAPRRSLAPPPPPAARTLKRYVYGSLLYSPCSSRLVSASGPASWGAYLASTGTTRSMMASCGSLGAAAAAAAAGGGCAAGAGAAPKLPKLKG